MKKALSLFLSVVLVLTVFSFAVPMCFAADEAPMLKVFTNENEAFYPYKDEITQIVFADSDDISIPAERWNISSDAIKPIWAWIARQDETAVLYIAGKGGVTLNPTSTGLFENFTKAESIVFNGVVNTSKVMLMEQMFAGCTSLSSIDLSDFDTSGVINMHEMFRDCQALTELDLSMFDISHVTTLDGMLSGCKALKTLNISNWFFPETLKTLNGFLAKCSSLKDVYIYDVMKHHNCIPDKTEMYEGTARGVKFHDNRNIGEAAELWTKFFEDAPGAVLVFDYPENYEVTISPESLILLTGQIKKLEASVYPKPENSVITWESSDNSVVTIDANTGEVEAVGEGTAIITAENITVDEGMTKVATDTIEITVTNPTEEDFYHITYEKPDNIEYYQVSTDGGESYITVHGGTFRYLRDQKLIIKVYGNALAYVFYVNGNEIESDEQNRLDVTVNGDKIITVRVVDVPSGEETVSFFERIIQWFRDLFAKIFGIFG